ncbi:MAG: hypothetical protein ACFFE8_09595 [Candidatus Heimdallarchaeota archaeon]
MSQRPEFLTEYELEVFRLVNEGKDAQQIADDLNRNENLNRDKEGKKIERSPENIRKTKVVVRKKLERELRKIAEANRLDLDLAKMPKDTGLLIAFDWVHNTKVYLIYTRELGVVAWWEHLCSDRCQHRCQDTLDLILRERQIKLPPELKDKSILDQFREAIAIIQR